MECHAIVTTATCQLFLQKDKWGLSQHADKDALNVLYLKASYNKSFHVHEINVIAYSAEEKNKLLFSDCHTQFCCAIKENSKHLLLICRALVLFEIILQADWQVTFFNIFLPFLELTHSQCRPWLARNYSASAETKYKECHRIQLKAQIPVHQNISSTPSIFLRVTIHAFFCIIYMSSM